MNCRVAQQLINDYLDDVLDDGVREAFARHVEECPYCRSLLEETQLAREALRGVASGDVDVPSDLRARIVSAVREAEQERAMTTGSGPPALGSPAFIATCASLLVGAVMCYVVTTRVYMRDLDAQVRRADSPSVAIAANGPSLSAAGAGGASMATRGPAFGMLAATEGPVPSVDAEQSGSKPPPADDTHTLFRPLIATAEPKAAPLRRRAPRPVAEARAPLPVTAKTPAATSAKQGGATAPSAESYWGRVTGRSDSSDSGARRRAKKKANVESAVESQVAPQPDTAASAPGDLDAPGDGPEPSASETQDCAPGPDTTGEATPEDPEAGRDVDATDDVAAGIFAAYALNCYIATGAAGPGPVVQQSGEARARPEASEPKLSEPDPAH